PDYRLAYDIRATCYFKMNQHEKALEDYRKCVQLSATDHRSYYNIGLILYSFKKYDEAISNLTTAINLSPLGNYYVYRALCYQKKGDVANARADVQMAVQRKAGIP